MPEKVRDHLAELRLVIAALDDVVVAFSGGADSALLAWVANDTLGPDHTLAVTAVSPSLATDEEADCRALAAEWGLSWQTVITDELANPAYAANDGQRCFHCKSALMDALTTFDRTVLLGVNVDDLGDHRPGQQAAAERGALFPFVDVGLTKQDVRDLSRQLGLRTWDKPAAACLSSRLPYGTPVTITALREVGVAESALHALGFRSVRVRHYGDTARIEFELADLDAVMAKRAEIVEVVRAAGYRYVTVDLEGLRSGNLNQALSN